MAGLAAALNVPDAVEKMGATLAVRGPEEASCRVDGDQGARLEVLVRAVLPSIVRVVANTSSDAAEPGAAGSEPGPDGAAPAKPGPDGAGPAEPEQRVVAAIVVDGVASMSALDAGYAADGPAGLLQGKEAYAVVLADAEHDALVLGRNGAAPSLYYARQGEGWIVASEPAALIAAGVAARPDTEVVARFVSTGEVDDTPATFFQHIAQVRPDEVVVLDRDGTTRRQHVAGEPRTLSVTSALNEAVGPGRLAVLVRPGRLGAAVLGAALARPGCPAPLPVHTAAYADLEEPAARTPAVLAPLPHGTVRHTPHTFDVSTLDIDGFLREVGEPVPDLDLYALWAVARDLGGGADVLVDSGRGRLGGVARVSDRLTARYGVSIRCPLRGAGGPADDDDVATLINRTLPPAVARYAARDSAHPAGPREIVLRLRDEVAAALAIDRPWSDSASSVDALRRLAAGEPIDAEVLLRAYLVERWLGALGLDGGVEAVEESSTESSAEPAEPVGVGDVAPEDSYWLRWPVRTPRLGPDAHLPTALAFHAEAALTDLSTHRAYRDALRGPWFAVVTGKALAVAQRRFTPLWSVEPGPLARLLARLAGTRLPLLTEAWTMQVAIDEVGRLRMLGAVVAARLRRRAWLDRLLPDGAPVFAPRPEAVPPADSAVVRTPLDADGFAEAFVAALRYSLPPALYETLAGVAVVRADETGSRVLGFTAGPFGDAMPRAEELVARACADNPAGQGRQRTPLLLVFEAPAPRPRDRGRDPRELDLKPDRARSSSRAF
jgi:hypothetical protein